MKNYNNYIKNLIKNNTYSKKSLEKVESKLENNKIEEKLAYYNYLLHFIKNTYNEELKNKLKNKLRLEYLQWEDNYNERKGSNYINLIKLYIKFYFNFNKYNKANTFIIQYFDLKEENNSKINNSWPWRYRFKCKYEIAFDYILKKPIKYLNWLNKAFLIEKRNKENSLSINVFNDYKNKFKNKYPGEYSTFFSKIKKYDFDFLKYVKIDLEETGIVSGDFVLGEKSKSEIKKEDRSVTSTLLEEEEKEKKEYKKILKDKLNKLEQSNKKLIKENNIFKDKLLAEEQIDKSMKSSLNSNIIIKKIGIIGDSKINNRTIKGIIKSKLKNHDIKPPINKNIEILASEYLDTKKTSLKSKINNNTYNWLIIGAHPHKIKNFSDGIENYIKKAIEGGWCSLKYTQCTSTNGNLDNIAKSNLKRAVDKLIDQEKSEL